MNNNTPIQTDRLDIVYYTDPLCCWSWGLDPHLQQLKKEFEGNYSIRYCMGGLIECWNNFNDDLNSVTRPIQMGPLWMQASHMCGVPINSNIWVTDPPASSYLACIAVKCAFLQSENAGESYLQLLRENLMLKSLNIASQSNLLKVAAELSNKEGATFDAAQFATDLTNGKGMEAFRSDLQEVRYRNISRFPTLILSNGSQAGIVVTGYRTYQQLLDIIQRLNANSASTQQPANEQAASSIRV